MATKKKKTSMGGYAGTILCVDLSNQAIEKIPMDTDLARGFIGGHGINAKLLYDLVKPGTDPLSPENVLIFGTGPLVGTMYPTAGRATVMAKSPLSGLIGLSNGGHLGAMLKFAGYDHLIIKGRADRPVYLKIDEEDVRILDATHLWGKDVFEATDRLWSEIGDEYWVSCIGQAGENLVKFACILNNEHSAFGRTGLGAVMGSKNLKAVALHGRRAITVSDPGKFMKLVDQALRSINEHPDEIGFVRKLGTIAWLLQTDFRSFVEVPPPGHRDKADLNVQAYLDEFHRDNFACHACPIGCKLWLKPKEGPAFGVSCAAGSMASAWMALSIPTWAEQAKLTESIHRYGMDTIDTCAVITLAIELYEAGVISKEDTDGLEVQWGNAKVVQELMRRIAFREGLGDALAEGTVGASQRIGRESEEYVIAIKGLSVPTRLGVDFRSRLHNAFQFGGIVNPRGWHPDSYKCLFMPPFVGDRDTILDAVKKSGQAIGIPAQAMERILTGEVYNLPLYTKFVEQYGAVLQSIGVCDRPYECLGEVTNIEKLAEAFSAATGIEATPAELLLAGERIWNIQKAFNIRQGASRKDDRVPERLQREPLETQRGTFPPITAEEIDVLLDEYYEAHGWEKETSKPTNERLKALGLEAVAMDLECYEGARDFLTR